MLEILVKEQSLKNCVVLYNNIKKGYSLSPEQFENIETNETIWVYS